MTDNTSTKCATGSQVTAQAPITTNSQQQQLARRPSLKQKTPYYPFLPSKPGGTLPPRNGIAGPSRQSNAVSDPRLPKPNSSPTFTNAVAVQPPSRTGDTTIISSSVVAEVSEQFKVNDLVDAVVHLAKKGVVDNYQVHYDYAEASWKNAERRCAELEDQVSRLERIRGEEKGRLEATVARLQQQLLTQQRDDSPPESVSDQHSDEADDDTQAEIFTLRSIIGRMKQSHSAAMLNQGNQLRKSKEKVMNELNGAQSQVQALETALIEERDKTTTLSTVIQQQKAQIYKKLAEEKKRFEAEITRLKATIAQLQKQKEEAVEEKENQTYAETTELQAVLVHFQKHKAESEAKITKLDAETTNLKNLVVQLRREKAEAEKLYESKISSLTGISMQLTREKGEMEESWKSKLDSETSKLKNAIMQLRKQNDEQQAKSDGIITQLQKEKAEMAEMHRTQLDAETTAVKNNFMELQQRQRAAMEANKMKFNTEITRLNGIIAQVEMQKGEMEIANKANFDAETNKLRNLIEQSHRQNALAEEGNQILKVRMDKSAAELEASMERERKLNAEKAGLRDALRKERSARESLVTTLAAALDKSKADLKRKVSGNDEEGEILEEEEHESKRIKLEVGDTEPSG